MVNHWMEKKNKSEKLEEARLALQKWCNKIAYDDFGMYRSSPVTNWDKPMKARRRFFEENPEYKEFEMDLRITWNMHHEGGHPTRKSMNAVSDPSWPNDATGIPQVTHYPECWWEECAEIARRAKPNYYDHKEERNFNHREGTYQAWVGDKIAISKLNATEAVYRMAYKLKPEESPQQHLKDRVTKFWYNMLSNMPNYYISEDD